MGSVRVQSTTLLHISITAVRVKVPPGSTGSRTYKQLEQEKFFSPESSIAMSKVPLQLVPTYNEQFPLNILSRCWREPV